MEHEFFDLNTPYNFQGDNRLTPNATGWAQCGGTSAIMVASQYRGKNECTDEVIYRFLDWLEPSFGLPGIGEEIVKSNKALLKERLGAHIECYSMAIERWLNGYGIKGKSILHRGSGSFEDIFAAIDAGNPVLLGTMITESGHFIVIRGYSKDRKFVKCNDPAGSAFLGYGRPGGGKDGDGVIYPVDWLERKSLKSTYGIGYFYFRKE